MVPVVSMKGLGYRYGRSWALKDLDLLIRPGEVLGILGPNGSGKSTLLKVLDGILRPHEGEVLLKGKPLSAFSRPALAREVAMVAQESHFQYAFSVLEVVLMARFPYLKRFQFEGRRDMEAAQGAMALTHCGNLADRSIHELSGGEKQRVLIARALAQEPAVILLDEPTSFLDLRYKREIYELISSLATKQGKSVVVVSHDMDLAGRYCHRLILLRDGHLHAEGPPARVMTASHIEAVFGCPVAVDHHPVTGSPRVSLI